MISFKNNKKFGFLGVLNTGRNNRYPNVVRININCY